MPKSTSERRESGWLTVDELSRALDVTAHFVRSDIVKLIPRSCVRRGPRNRLEVYGREALESYFRARPPAPLPTKLLTDAELDALLDDGILAADTATQKPTPTANEPCLTLRPSLVMTNTPTTE